MEFEFTGHIYVDPSDLDKMCRLCEECGFSPCDAAEIVAEEWDDDDYFCFEWVSGKIIEVIEKRISKNT